MRFQSSGHSSLEFKAYIPGQEMHVRVICMKMALKAKKKMEIRDMSASECQDCTWKANINSILTRAVQFPSDI